MKGSSLFFYICTVLLINLVSCAAKASNVMVIDGGLHPAYHQYLDEVEDRFLKESCYSVPGDKFITQQEQIDGLSGTHYKYKWASLCRNTKSEQHGFRASVIRDDGIKVLRNAGSRNRDLDITHPHHQSIVADVITQNTAQSVEQWHTHIQRLLGRYDGDGRLQYTFADHLESSGGPEALRRALKDVALGSEGLNGVEVINISGGQGLDAPSTVYSTPCDGDSDIRRDDINVEIINYINSLYNRGVITVVASANHTGNRLIDNYKMPFPACLSRTVAVAGYREYNGEVRGAVSPHTDFVHDMNHTNPITNRGEEGTSFAAPKVTAHIAQLREITTVRNVYGILNAMRETANYYQRERRYNNGQFRVQFSVLQPNYARARASVIDSFWSDLFRLNTDGAVRDDKVGWNYGSSSHRNGVRIEMITLPPLQQQNLFAGLEAVAQASQSSREVLRFSLNAYDIDTSDEVALEVNGTEHATLSTTGSNQLGGKQVFCIERSDLKPAGETNEVLLRVKSAGETWGVTNLKAERSFDISGCKFVVPDLPSNDDRIAGSSDAFGNGYQLDKVSVVPFNFAFSTSSSMSPTPTTYDSNTIRRDIRVRFTTRSGNTSARDNGTRVLLNNSTILTTENYFSDDERSYELIISRNKFRRGSNTVSFKPRDNGTNAIWGIRGVSIEYIEPIDLVVGTEDADTYGYNESPTRYTGLRANFSLTEISNDYGLTLKGWDIDRDDETEVFINGSSVGFLDVSANNNFSSDSMLVLKKNKLKVGLNQIELMQREPNIGVWWTENDEKWGAKDLNVSLLKPDLVPTSFVIDDSSILTSKPFSVTTVVQNAGAGIADASVLSYYVSEDDIITAADTYLERRSFGSLASGASVSVTNEVQSSMVNKGYFIGVCIAPIEDEASTANNCSQGIEMSNQLGYLPAILLILDD